MIFLQKKVDFERYRKADVFVKKAFEQVQDFVDNDTHLKKEIVRAKESYIELTGKIPNSEDDFNHRMNFFLVWFLFDWQSSVTLGQSPFELFLKKLLKNNQHELHTQLQKFRKSVHSIFKLERIDKGISTILDIFTKKKYHIADDNFLFSLETGSYFDTRLIYYDQQYVFNCYYNQHPKDVKAIINQQVKLIKKSKVSADQIEKKKNALILKINYFKNKLLIYKHVNSKDIYQF